MINESRQRVNTRRHLRLELCSTSEHNCRLDCLGWQEIKKLFNGTYVPHILKDRILKFELPTVEHLCPRRVLGVCKDPALVILGLDHEHPETGYQDVINLCGAVLELQRDVIKEVIVRARKVCLQLSAYQGLAMILRR